MVPLFCLGTFSPERDPKLLPELQGEQQCEALLNLTASSVFWAPPKARDQGKDAQFGPMVTADWSLCTSGLSFSPKVWRSKSRKHESKTLRKLTGKREHPAGLKGE